MTEHAMLNCSFFADLFEERKMAAGRLDNIWCFVCKSFPSCFNAVYLKGLTVIYLGLHEADVLSLFSSTLS